MKRQEFFARTRGRVNDRRWAMMYALIFGVCLAGNTSRCLGQHDPAFPKGALYVVAGVAQHDYLNMRIDPRPDAWIVLRIPPQAKDVMSTGRMEVGGNQR